LLSVLALKIIKQLKATNFKGFKKRLLWTKHYTITLWETEKDMKEFVNSSVHLEAMKLSKKIAKEIRTVTIEADELPNWNEVKRMLAKGKVITF